MLHWHVLASQLSVSSTTAVRWAAVGWQAQACQMQRIERFHIERFHIGAFLHMLYCASEFAARLEWTSQARPEAPPACTSTLHCLWQCTCALPHFAVLAAIYVTAVCIDGLVRRTLKKTCVAACLAVQLNVPALCGALAYAHAQLVSQPKFVVCSAFS